MAVIRRRWWLILLLILLSGGAAYGVSSLQEEEYETSAKLLFRAPGYAEDVFGTNALSSSGANNDPVRQAETNVRLVGLDVVADRTSKALRGRASPQEVSDSVQVAAEGASDVVSVTARDPQPRQAQVLANTFARQFVAFRAQTDRAKLQQARRLAERELEEMDPAQREGERGQALSRVADRLGVLASLQTGNAELVQRADLPLSPSSPKPARNTVLGAVLGLLLGVGLAFLLERLDRRLRTPNEAADAYDLPVLASIPESSKIRKGSELSPEDQEAFRTLRSTLRYFNVDQEVRSVLVTSAAPGEGKSTVAWHLAEAAAKSARVVLLEADLRKPSLSAKHGLDSAPGLAELLTNQVNLDLTGTNSGANGDSPSAGFDVIVAGRTPPNPVELIDSRAMKEILARLMTRYDLVVIDSPPPAIVSDVYPLLTRVSGVLVVCRLGKTTRDSAVAMRHHLRRLRAPLLGVVANRSRRRRHGYDQYSYGPETFGPAETGTAADRESVRA